MRIDGKWVLSDGGTLRPIVRAYLPNADGGWLPVPFVVDTGADKTVISFDTSTALGLELSPPEDYHLEGAGGVAASGLARVDLRLLRETGDAVTLRGPFNALSEPGTLDLNLLGRDVLGRFAVVVDRPGNVVCLLAGNHRYAVRPG